MGAAARNDYISYVPQLTNGLTPLMHQIKFHYLQMMIHSS